MTNLLINDKDLISFWNFEKNKDINVEKLTLKSNKKVWWKCSKGHEWQANIYNMSSSRQCPFCSNRKILVGFNDLATRYPNLAKEWDYTKNKGLLPENFSKTSEKKVWWICSENHSYLKRIDTRVRGAGCPYCNKKIAIKGENDILTLYPILDKYWNYEKNQNVNLVNVKVGDRKSYYWKCRNCGYEWKTRISHMIKDFKGCRKCERQVIVPDEKKLSNSRLITEWDYNKNKDNPCMISINSTKKVWWICSQGHSYLSRIDSRSRGTGCPYCSGHKVLKGFNDAGTLYPKILAEWDYDLNSITPYEVSIGSGKIVNFICEKSHTYKMTVRDFCSGYNCPVCSNRIIIKGINDFAHLCPRLLEEWDYDKNKIKPTNVSDKYTKKVYWIGKCGHKWKASIYSRTVMKTNCPICAEERHSSVSEKSVLYYIKKSEKFDEVFENYKDSKITLELDIYIPSINTAIEYDGERWHKNIEKDLKKDKLCEKNNIKLIRIRESGCPKYKSSSKKIYLKNNKTLGIENGIINLLKYLNIDNIDVNLDRDNSEILNMINFMVKENSILKLYPNIASEWHPNKNGNLKPEHTKPNSNKKVWWICNNGHEYQMDVYHRTKRNNGCPYCSNHKVLKGYNDLASLNKQLASEWNYKKNNNLYPDMVTPCSGKKVWWICKNGHEWENTVSHRSNGQNCPYCSGKKILKGYNDLATLNPELVKEWDYNKNDILPTELSNHSGKKVWWICKNCGYNWQATIDKRSNGRGCPNCHGKR